MTRAPARRPKRRPPARRGPAYPLIAVPATILLLLALAHLAITLTVLGIAAVTTALLWGRRHRTLRAARARDLQGLWCVDPHTLDPDGFERYLAALCERDGCTNVTVVGGAGDLAADVLYTDPSGHRGLIQAKRYQTGNTVGSEHVQRVNGTYRDIHRCEHAAIITTSSFTAAAANMARQVRIRLLDDQRLAAWATGTPGAAPWN